MNPRALTHYKLLALEADAAPGRVFWLLACSYSLLLTFASYEFAVRVLPVLRGWLS